MTQTDRILARTSALRAMVALASRLATDCPPMLMGGLLVRLAETADSDPADAEACTEAAHALTGYLAEYDIPLYALSEAGLIEGSAVVRAQLCAINTDMARLEALTAGLDSGYGVALWRPVGLAEARARRGVLSSARICSRLRA